MENAHQLLSLGQKKRIKPGVTILATDLWPWSSLKRYVVAVVKVKSHYEVTLLPQICTKARVEVGDLFEAKIEERTIALAPKRMINCELALALSEVKRGLVKGPFPTARRPSAPSAAGRHDCVFHAPFS